MQHQRCRRQRSVFRRLQRCCEHRAVTCTKRSVPDCSWYVISYIYCSPRAFGSASGRATEACSTKPYRLISPQCHTAPLYTDDVATAYAPPPCSALTTAFHSRCQHIGSKLNQPNQRQNYSNFAVARSRRAHTMPARQITAMGNTNSEAMTIASKSPA